MGAAENRAKNSKMASDLKAKGIFHGKRTTSPMHNNYPKTNEVGSAAYRRARKSRLGK
jgi:hypothetical protein